MTSSTHTKGVNSFNTGGNPIAFQLSTVESTKHIRQPVSTDEVMMKIWKCQMPIPFVINRKLVAFHEPLLDPKSTPKAVQGFCPSYVPAAPPPFDKAEAINVRFMDPKAKVFRSMPTPGNKEYLAWVNKVQRKRQDQWRSIGIFDAIQISRYAH